MWESRLLLARFPRGSWKELGSLPLAFHAFHSPVISTALFLAGFGFDIESRRLIRPRFGFPPVDSSWPPPRGSS